MGDWKTKQNNADGLGLLVLHDALLAFPCLSLHKAQKESFFSCELACTHVVTVGNREKE